MTVHVATCTIQKLPKIRRFNWRICDNVLRLLLIFNLIRGRTL